MQGKKNLIVYGNCQSGCIDTFLQRDPVFSAEINVHLTKGVHEYNDAEIGDLANKLDKIDIFVYQNVSEQFRGKLFSTNQLKKLLPNTCTLISIPSLHFNPYFPNLIYIYDEHRNILNGPGGAYHNTDILSCYARGLTQAAATQHLSEVHTDDLEQSRSSLAPRIDDMARREVDLDVKSSDYIMNNFRKRRLFYTFNHPANEVMFDVCQQIASFLGKSFDPARIGHVDEWLSGVSYPIRAASRAGLALEFGNDERYNLDGKPNLTQEQALVEFYNFYDKNPDIIERFKSMQKHN